MLHRYAQWRTQRQCAIGGDAVPGNHTCSMCCADATDAPDDGAGADQTFTDAQTKAADQQRAQTQPRQFHKPGCQNQEGATGSAGQHATDDGFLGADGIDHTSGLSACDKSRQILHADRQARDEGAVTQIQMNITRQHRKRDANGQVSQKGEQHRRQDLRNDSVLRWRRHGRRGGRSRV